MTKKFSFGLPQPEFSGGNALATGLPGWKHEVKPKDGETIRFIPLHSVSECLGVWVHQKQQKYDGGFKYVPVGSRNTHLFPAVYSPFEHDPNPDVSKYRLARWMLVYVSSGAGELDGHVGFLELKFSDKHPGVGNNLQSFEENEGQEITGHRVSLTRKGKGMYDTSYTSSIGAVVILSDEEQERIDNEVEEVSNYLKSLYTEGWTEERFHKVYTGAIINGVAPVQSTETPVADVEIPF